MKTITYLLSTLAGIALLVSCVKDECIQTKEFTQYTPVFITQTQFEAPAAFATERPMENTGTIFVWGRYLFVNEFQKGIHIIDNQEPENPIITGFLDIPGNTHFTIRNDILYANKMEDLLVIDVSDVNQPKQVNRLKGLFQLNRAQTTHEGIIAYYEKTNETLEVDCNDYRYSSVAFTRGDDLFFDFAAPNARIGLQFAQGNNTFAVAEKSQAPATMGVGGSMARFTTIRNQLYILSSHVLEVVDISTGNNPVHMGELTIQFNAETIYPFGSHLYIGTTNGMHIYSVSSDGLPEHISTTAHVQSCDPVISDGDYAYVTLRGGTPCGGFTNQLEAYDLDDPLKPELVQQFPMDNPHGLTKVGDFLYVCEGSGGWKKIRSKLPGPFKTEWVNEDHSAFDVLFTPQQTLLFVGRNGIYQYDLNGKNPKQISELKIELP